MTNIGHVSEILYMYDQLKENPYGSRTIVADHISRLGKCWLDSATGSDLARKLMEFSEEQLLDVIRVTKAVYAIPTNREVDTDSDSDSIEKFG